MSSRHDIHVTTVTQKSQTKNVKVAGVYTRRCHWSLYHGSFFPLVFYKACRPLWLFESSTCVPAATFYLLSMFSKDSYKLHLLSTLSHKSKTQSQKNQSHVKGLVVVGVRLFYQMLIRTEDPRALSTVVILERQNNKTLKHPDDRLQVSFAHNNAFRDSLIPYNQLKCGSRSTTVYCTSYCVPSRATAAGSNMMMHEVVAY